MRLGSGHPICFFYFVYGALDPGPGQNQTQTNNADVLRLFLLGRTVDVPPPWPRGPRPGLQESAAPRGVEMRGG